MNGFVKIYGSKLITSSLWDEPPEVRLVFLGLLALADSRGFIDVPNEKAMARMLNLEVDYVEKALAVLMAPDRGSRTVAHDGRRLLREGSGWLCVNYEKYREFRSKAQEKTRERVERYRARKSVTSNECNGVKRAEAEAEAEADQIPLNPPLPKSAPAPVPETSGPAAPADRGTLPEPKYPRAFEEVWERTGRVGNKFKGWEAWKKAKSPPWAALQASWASYLRSADPVRGYVQHLSTWLNKKGWAQDWPPAGPKGSKPARPPEPSAPAPRAPRCSHHEKNDRFRNPHPVDWCPGCREQVAREGTRTMTAEELLEPPDWMGMARGGQG